VRIVHRAVGLVVLVAVSASPAGAALRDRFSQTASLVGIQGGSAFDALGDAIADSAARSLPIISASAGFTYRYNPQLEIFERTSDTLGPLLLERPDTLGQGKLNVNVSYMYVDLNQLDGTATNKLEGPFPIVIRRTGAGGTTFTADQLRYSFKLVNHIAGVSVTYGVLDNLDVNILLPVISTAFDVTARDRTVSDLMFNPTPGPERAAGLHDHENSIGDILLRAKYQLEPLGIFRHAAGLQLRLPSGDKDNFQGTGDFEASPFYYLSTVLWGRVEPHANLGLDLRTDDVAKSQARWGLGVDVDVVKRVGLSLGFQGRDQFSGSASASDTSFLHLTPSGVRAEPLLGIDFGRKDFFDLSFGVRAVVWRQLMVFLNGIYALNDDGLRNDSVIPVAGLEGTF
jgi:hypothetical protein